MCVHACAAQQEACMMWGVLTAPYCCCSVRSWLGSVCLGGDFPVLLPQCLPLPGTQPQQDQLAAQVGSPDGSAPAHGLQGAGLVRSLVSAQHHLQQLLQGERGRALHPGHGDRGALGCAVALGKVAGTYALYK